MEKYCIFCRKKIKSKRFPRKCCNNLFYIYQNWSLRIKLRKSFEIIQWFQKSAILFYLFVGFYRIMYKNDHIKIPEITVSLRKVIFCFSRTANFEEFLEK